MQHEHQHVDGDTAAWLQAAACGLDTGAEDPAVLLPALARGGLTRSGVARDLGGGGGDVADAVLAIAEVSALSLAAGFVLWGHRTYIEYLLESPNAALRAAQLADLLDGRIAGATGLSNAMKFLAGLEELQIKARNNGSAGKLLLDGRMPWVTNIRSNGFHVAAVASHENGSPLVVAFSHDDAGLSRSADLDLMALRSTSTAAISLNHVEIGPDRVLHHDAGRWLPKVRPAFLGLQCGMSIGLARRALREAAAAIGKGRSVLHEPLNAITAALDAQVRQLLDGLRSNLFLTDAPALFRIRIALADIVAEAVALELQASGGRAYLSGPGRDFARRWREAAFVPVITPSLVQLKAALTEHQKSAA